MDGTYIYDLRNLDNRVRKSSDKLVPVRFSRESAAAIEIILIASRRRNNDYWSHHEESDSDAYSTGEAAGVMGCRGLRSYGFDFSRTFLLAGDGILVLKP